MTKHITPHAALHSSLWDCSNLDEIPMVTLSGVPNTG